MSMRFGIYLVDNNYITAAQFVSLVKSQLDQREAIGQTALRMGLMNVEQVYQTLALQIKNQKLSFGKAAIQLGFLTVAEYSQLLVAQAQSDLSLRNQIVKNGWLSRDKIEQLFDQFRCDCTSDSALKTARPKRPKFKPNANRQRNTPISQ
jgi:hypothetical protein